MPKSHFGILLQHIPAMRWLIAGILINNQIFLKLTRTHMIGQKYAFVRALLCTVLFWYAPIALVAQEELRLERISAFISDGSLGLGAIPITTAAMDSASNLYLPAELGTAIGVVSRTGEVTRKIGASGEGPGEFQWIHDLGLLGDSILWAYDSRSDRLSLFTLHGELLTDRLIPGAQSAALMNNGKIVVLLGQRDPWRPSGAHWTIATLNWDDDFVDRKVLRSRWEPKAVLRIRLQSRIATWRQPWSPLLRIAFSNGHEVSLLVPIEAEDPLPTGQGWIISLTSSSADQIRIDSALIVLPAVQVTDERVESYVDSLIANLPDKFRSDRLRARLRDSLYVPPTAPVGRDIVHASENYWIADATSPLSTKWWLVDRSGHPLGWITLPSRSNLLAARDDKLWVVELGQFDIPTLVLYRVYW